MAPPTRPTVAQKVSLRGLRAVKSRLMWPGFFTLQPLWSTPWSTWTRWLRGCGSVLVCVVVWCFRLRGFGIGSSRSRLPDVNKQNRGKKDKVAWSLMKDAQPLPPRSHTQILNCHQPPVPRKQTILSGFPLTGGAPRGDSEPV